MQWNQYFGNLAFERSSYNAYNQTLPPYTQVTGEGEVTSVYLPDGNMHMFFIPTIRHDRWSPHYCNGNVPNITNLHKSINQECWFVRNITGPISTIFNNLAYINGHSLPSQLFSSENILPIRPQYCQKFHNDNSTSTTDIFYFYPNLRQERTTLNYPLIETNAPTANYNISYDGVNKAPCKCKVSFKVEEKIIDDKCDCQESASSMSVDSVKVKSEHSFRNKQKYHGSTKNKNGRNKCERRDHICECNKGAKDKSDKSVTTYVDRASGNVQIDGRETQTLKSKRNGIKTEIWIPMKTKRRTRSNSSTNTHSECASCCYTDDCACASASENDDE